MMLLARIRETSLVSSGEPIIHMWISALGAITSVLGAIFFAEAITKRYQKACQAETFIAKGRTLTLEEFEYAPEN